MAWQLSSWRKIVDGLDRRNVFIAGLGPLERDLEGHPARKRESSISDLLCGVSRSPAECNVNALSELCCLLLLLHLPTKVHTATFFALLHELGRGSSFQEFSGETVCDSQ